MTKQLTEFDDRLVVITGAGCGIGRATALRFAGRGATVIVTDIDMDRAHESVRLVRAAGGRAFAYLLDVADDEAWAAFAAQLDVDHGVPDVLVNNAGYTTGGRFVDHGPADWDGMLRVNVRGVVVGSRTFGRRMIEAGKRGAIVNVASGAAYIPIPLSSLYCTTKAAVKAASDCLHIELAQHGIGVTAICPGVVDTSFANDVRHVGVDPAEAELRRSLITGLSRRFAHDPDLVAKAIVKASVRRRATQPAGFESHLGYAVSRISPETLRLMARLLKADTLVGFTTTSLPAPLRTALGLPS